MRLRVTILFSLLIFAAGCSKDNGGDLKISSSSVKVDAYHTKTNISINSSSSWELRSNASWCVPSKTSGTNDATVEISLEPNPTLKERVAILTMTDQSSSQEITIIQGGEIKYTLPVVFHVLYADRTNANQYVKEGLLPQILSACNQLFAGNNNIYNPNRSSVDMNLEFTMATTTPDGKTMSEPGVNRIQVTNPVFDCYEFTNYENTTYTQQLWDPSRYINIYLYTFSEPNTYGISPLAYSSSTNPLDGLFPADVYFTPSKLRYPHAVNINNQYINRIAPDGIYFINDVVCTLTHELAHYLGLFHAFGVTTTEGSWRDNTDYCNDTPHYDRDAYDVWLNNYQITTAPEDQSFSDMIMRTSITGDRFVSENLMDYAFSWNDMITPDQRKRMRHVLHHSPLVPGPKYGKPTGRSIESGEIPPMRTIE